MMRAKAELGFALILATMAMFSVNSGVSWGNWGDIVSLTVNVLRLVFADLAVSELTVGGLGGAITAGQVVDDET